MTAEVSSHIKTLKQRDMVLFTVSAILLLDTLALGEVVIRFAENHKA
jgi:hypothetical protein